MLINRLHPFARFMEENNDGNKGGEGAPTTPPAKVPATPPATPPGITQDQLDAAVAKGIADNNATRDKAEAGLKKNKEELHTELKDLQKKTREAEDAIRMKEGNVGEVTKEIEARVKGEFQETIATQREEIANFKLAEHNKTMEAFVDELNELANIKPSARRGRKLEILADHKIETDENGKMTIDGRNQQEFIENWLQNGQHVNDLVLASTSNGGGANGGKTPAGATGLVKVLGAMEGGDMFAAASKAVLDNK